MRCSPVMPLLLFRKAKKTFELKGYTIPQGMSALIWDTLIFYLSLFSRTLLMSCKKNTIHNTRQIDLSVMHKMRILLLLVFVVQYYHWCHRHSPPSSGSCTPKYHFSSHVCSFSWWILTLRYPRLPKCRTFGEQMWENGNSPNWAEHKPLGFVEPYYEF